MTDPPRKTIHDLTAAEHFERIRAERAGRAWEPPPVDETHEHPEGEARRVVGDPATHLGPNPNDLSAQDIFNRIKRS